MRARVFVTLKPSVFDPQGSIVTEALHTLGYAAVKDVRQGKYFEIALDDSVNESEAREAAEKIAGDVLANPVIEDYRVEIVN